MDNQLIAIESAKSLHVRSTRKKFDSEETLDISSGTAFVVHNAGAWYLISNLHVLTGRDPITGRPEGFAALPTTLSVWHNASEGLGHWVDVDYSLYDDDGRACWYEHPKDPGWDVVALQIRPQDGIQLYPYELTDEGERLLVGPGFDLSIVGFPFGTASDGRFAIWNRATIASDLDLNYGSRPTFLVDSRSRPGQSGSPVIAKPFGTAMYANGSFIANGANPVELMGIYSGRISTESDLGIVWKAHVIRELVTFGRRSGRTIDD